MIITRLFLWLLITDIQSENKYTLHDYETAQQQQWNRKVQHMHSSYREV